MYEFLIEGENPLGGDMTLSGGKNAALPSLCASLLTDKPVILRNIPKISDVRVILKIIKILGGEIEYLNSNDIKICNKNLSIDLKKQKLIFENMKKLRGSILLLAPLLYRFKDITLVSPGGDKIGQRELSAHFEGLKTLGYNIDFNINEFRVYGKPFLSTNIFLYEPSVTATENLLMICSTIEGETVIENAACEPHVKDLEMMLISMGAKIEGVGSNILKIKGKNNLLGVDHTIISDSIEATSYMIFALLSKGFINVHNINSEEMKSILYVFDIFNVKYTTTQNSISILEKQDLYYKKELGFSNLGIYSHPYPGFPTDIMSLFIVLASQVRGEIIFFEKMYENRLDFAIDLKSMGADYTLLDTHRLMSRGIESLHSGKLFAKDIRSGVAYLAAMLGAKGTSHLRGVDHIDRAYPNIDRNLAVLGAKIQRKRI